MRVELDNPSPKSPVQSSDPSLPGNINTITSGLGVPSPASHICQGQGTLVSVEGRRQRRPSRRCDWREVGSRKPSSESQAQLQVREGPKRGSEETQCPWGHKPNSCRWVGG